MLSEPARRCADRPRAYRSVSQGPASIGRAGIDVKDPKTLDMSFRMLSRLPSPDTAFTFRGGRHAEDDSENDDCPFDGGVPYDEDMEAQWEQRNMVAKAKHLHRRALARQSMNARIVMRAAAKGELSPFGEEYDPTGRLAAMRKAQEAMRKASFYDGSRKASEAFGAVAPVSAIGSKKDPKTLDMSFRMSARLYGPHVAFKFRGRHGRGDSDNEECPFDDSVPFAEDAEAQWQQRHMAMEAKRRHFRALARQSINVRMAMQAEAKEELSPFGEEYDPSGRYVAAQRAEAARRKALAAAAPASARSSRSKVSSHEPGLATAPHTDRLAESADGRWLLTVEVVSAMGLRPPDRSREIEVTWMGSSDPYCEVQLRDKPASKWRTKRVHNTQAPIWNAKRLMDGYEAGDDLELEILDWNLLTMRGQPLGSTTLANAYFHRKGGFEGVLPLPNAGSEGACIKVRISVEADGALPSGVAACPAAQQTR